MHRGALKIDQPVAVARPRPSRGVFVSAVTAALLALPAPVWGGAREPARETPTGQSPPEAPVEDAAEEEEYYDVGDDPLFGDEPVAGEEAEGLDDFGDDPLFDDDFDFELDDAPAAYPDPFEEFNRGVLAFNGYVDRFVMDPITVVYRFVVPEQARRSVERFFDNVNSTQTLVNDLFQLEWRDAGVTGARLLVNSTAGVAGLFDPAERWGLEGHSSDFGQTLAIAGAPSGPYFMLPLLGPSNVRDGVGVGVDVIFHPTFFLLGGTDVLFFSGSSGLTERARHYEELKALEESSIDFYAALRSGYYQNRQSEIWSRREDRRPEDVSSFAAETSSTRAALDR